MENKEFNVELKCEEKDIDKIVKSLTDKLDEIIKELNV